MAVQAQRVVEVLDNPAAQRVTVGELIAQRIQHPHHLQVWVADPTNPNGYTPLDGVVVLGEDPDPGHGEPSSFIVLGRDEISPTVHEQPEARTAVERNRPPR